MLEGDFKLKNQRVLAYIWRDFGGSICWNNCRGRVFRENYICSYDCEKKSYKKFLTNERRGVKWVLRKDFLVAKLLCVYFNVNPWRMELCQNGLLN